MNLDAAAAALKLGRMTLWRTENGRYENDVPIRPSQATMDALVRAGVCTAADFFEPADPDEPGAGEAAAA